MRHGGRQRFVRALFDDVAIDHHDDQVRREFGQAVGDHEGCRPRAAHSLRWTASPYGVSTDGSLIKMSTAGSEYARAIVKVASRRQKYCLVVDLGVVSVRIGARVDRRPSPVSSDDVLVVAPSCRRRCSPRSCPRTAVSGEPCQFRCATNLWRIRGWIHHRE